MGSTRATRHRTYSLPCGSPWEHPHPSSGCRERLPRGLLNTVSCTESPVNGCSLPDIFWSSGMWMCTDPEHLAVGGESLCFHGRSWYAIIKKGDGSRELRLPKIRWAFQHSKLKHRHNPTPHCYMVVPRLKRHLLMILSAAFTQFKWFMPLKSCV